MTVIAWDGTTLAVDSMSESGGLVGRARKLLPFEGEHGRGLLSGCGSSRALSAMAAWFRSDAGPEAFPTLVGDDADRARLVVIYEDGRVAEYEGSAYPIEERAVPYAWGCGAQLAVGAMAHGASAVEAAAIACEHHSGCGGPVYYARPNERAVFGQDGGDACSRRGAR